MFSKTALEDFGTFSFTDDDGDVFTASNFRSVRGDDQGDRVEITVTMNGRVTNTLEWIRDNGKIERMDTRLSYIDYGSDAVCWIHDVLDDFLDAESADEWKKRDAPKKRIAA